MENRVITKMPYKEKNTLAVMLCFMSRSALVSTVKSSSFFSAFLIILSTIILFILFYLFIHFFTKIILKKCFVIRFLAIFREETILLAQGYWRRYNGHLLIFVVVVVVVVVFWYFVFLFFVNFFYRCFIRLNQGIYL